MVNAKGWFFFRFIGFFVFLFQSRIFHKLSWRKLKNYVIFPTCGKATLIKVKNQILSYPCYRSKHYITILAISSSCTFHHHLSLTLSCALIYLYQMAPEHQGESSKGKSTKLLPKDPNPLWWSHYQCAKYRLGNLFNQASYVWPFCKVSWHFWRPCHWDVLFPLMAWFPKNNEVCYPKLVLYLLSP